MTRLTLTLRQPAQVSTRRRSDNVRETASHLPGWVVRGAFAAAFIRCFGPPAEARHRDEFVTLFEGAVRFPPLYSGGLPHSLSLLTHKYPASGCQAGDVDLALRPTEVQPRTRCAKCLEPLKGLRGIPDAGRTRRHTSTQVDARGVAVAETLHSRDSLDAGLTFSGTLTGDSGGLDLLGMIADEVSLTIGGRRTTRGLVTAEFSDDPVGEPSLPLVRDDGLLVLRLESPAVFVGDDGRPQSTPDPDELASALEVDHAKVIERWTRWEQIGGWHAASRLPKPVEIAVAAGSTYLVEPSARPSDDALVKLMTRGLGLRRHEGFGHVAPEARTLAGLPDETVRQLVTNQDDLAIAKRYLAGSARIEIENRIKTIGPRTKRGRALKGVLRADTALARKALGVVEGDAAE